MRLRILFISFLLCAFIQAGDIQKVVGVHDGDTVTLLDQDNHSIKVRLNGIDAPELKQPGGKKAKQFLSNICFNKQVRLEKSGTDRYNRTLGWLYTMDGKSINLMMVDSGFAWNYKQYSKGHPELELAEDAARASRINIWSMRKPIPPWEYRAKKKKK